MPRLPVILGFIAGLALSTSGCTTEDDSYNERRDYLQKVAQRGAETHELLASQQALINAERCGNAYEGLADQFVDRPRVSHGDIDDRWANLIKVFFVDSCVSGFPKRALETLPSSSVSPTVTDTQVPVTPPPVPTTTSPVGAPPSP